MAWVYGNRYLTIDEMKNNADIMHYFFKSNKWSDNAIAAVFGNMQTESTMNPGIWEGLAEYKGGYGLVQWTPYTKYSDWAGSNWENNGDKQLERIIYELNNGLQWISTDKYPMTFREFITSDTDPYTLSQVWLYNYERPDVLPQPQRGKQANYWYQYITGQTPPEPVPELPIWLLFRFNRKEK